MSQLTDGWGSPERAGPLTVVRYSVAKSRPTFCDPMDCSTLGFPVLQYFLEFAQTHVHWVDNAIQPSHPLSSPSPPAPNLCSTRVFSNESALESPLDSKGIKSVNPKGNLFWICIGRTDAETPVLWHLMWRTDTFQKTLILGKIKIKRRKGQKRMR